MTLGASSEVGRLRTVMLHRPGPELKRLTPRNNDKLLYEIPKSELNKDYLWNTQIKKTTIGVTRS